jgi:hypothetical protein
MNRRQVLKLGTTLAAVTGAGLGARYALLPPRRSRRLAGVKELATRFVDSLSGDQVEQVCLPYDHPYRQYHNRGVGGGGADIDLLSFSRAQRGILTDLFHAGLSAEGRERVPHQFFVNWPGVHLMRILVCGDPRTTEYQLHLSGPHLNLRLGGSNREGVAFGGPQVYGDQRGNESQGLPGNVYRHQFRIAQGLFASLRPEQQSAALLPTAPIQTRIEYRGSSSERPGLELTALDEDGLGRAQALIDSILASYPEEDVAYARHCLEANGGLATHSISWYEEGEVAHSGEYQIFRLEGPASVFYFRGHPHVHAFMNVAMEGDCPFSVGEELGVNPVVLESVGVKALFERAMRSRTDADFAYYDLESAVGRLRAGPVRTGDIYNLESWQDHVAVVRVKGAHLRARYLEELRSRGAEVQAERLYSIATTGEVLAYSAEEELGPFVSSRREMLLRDAAIDHIRAAGFS